MNSSTSAVADYCKLYASSGKTPEEFARRMLAHMPNLCLQVLEIIGSWPSSEPELAALQKAYR